MSKKEQTEAVEKSQYFVAEKVEITSKRGQLKGGSRVFARDFPTGQKRVDELVAAGHLVKK